MRSLTAFLAGVVAVLALAVALPTAWVDRNVADEDGYVALSRTLLEDEEIRRNLVASVAGAIDASARDLAQRNGVPPALVPDVRAQVESVAENVLTTDAAVEAWAESQRLSWQRMFDGTAPGFVVVLDPLVSVLAQSVGVQVGDAGTAVVIDDPAVQSAVQRAEQAGTAWAAAAVIGVLAALICLLAARRRSVALAWLGVGAIAAAGAVWVVTQVVSRAAAARADDLAATVGGAVVEAATSSLDDWLVLTAIVGAVVAVVGAVAAAATGRR